MHLICLVSSKNYLNENVFYRKEQDLNGVIMLESMFFPEGWCSEAKQPYHGGTCRNNGLHAGLPCHLAGGTLSCPDHPYLSLPAQASQH